ncbi:MAG: glycoside hydrolase family 9 protein [Planctomycetes bacterium]|nr:glycoside hydrolase family 9 protein [Planctomycetota bacterium]
MPMRALILLCLFLGLLGGLPNAMGFGVESQAGLRSAERMSATEIQLVTGPGLNAGEAAKRPQVFQVVSASDKDFQTGIGAASVAEVKAEEDLEYPAGWAGPVFKRHTLKVTLPADKPMKDGQRYWIRINAWGVIGCNRAAQWIAEPGKTPPEQLDPRTGLRELYVLAPNTLHAIAGPGIDVKRLYELKNVALSSSDDPEYKAPVNPARVGRRSNLDAYIPDGWPWRFLQRHEIFLVFEKPLKPGCSYALDCNAVKGAPVLCGVSRMTLKLDDCALNNLALKVNQAGYLPDAKEKYAYLGMWMGELNACDFGPCAKSFEVRDAKTHEVALKGEPKLRRKATYKLEDGKLTPDPEKVKGPETVYKQDLSFEDVYQLDLSPLNKEGEYYVAVPGMGRSFSFRVARDVYAEPFKIVMNGVFHQRSGMDLKEPYASVYSLAGHRNKTEYSTFRAGVDSDPWKNLPKHATDGKTHDIFGGHHDAGDWNPRSHLDVAETLFLLYELNPGAFADGQLKIPENANGIPDLLDEARWALDLWTRLQDEDGGVRDGIESNGDPAEGDTPATDHLREFAFAKDAKGSYGFAAIAAQASALWKGLGKAEDAKGYLEKAVRAWDWAEKNGGENEHDRHAFAAAMLFRATGDAKYDEAFKKHSVYSQNPKSEPDVYGKYDQALASFYYASAPKCDAALKAAIAASFENQMRYWIACAETTTYRYLRSSHAPNTWGTGGLPKWLVKPALALRLTSDDALRQALRQWIVFTCDFSLGCDPMNLVFTVGLGQRYVTSAWHILMHGNPNGIIPGLQSEGPGGRFDAGESPKQGGMDAWPSMSLFPRGPWPDLYKFSEDASPGMNEGVVSNMALTAFAYGLLLPAK